MTVAPQQRSTRETLHNLPALPQVLLKLLEAISNDEADIPHLAQIIRQDSAITARLLAIANSSLYNPLRHCNTVERALMSLGLETVRTIVLTAAFKQHFSLFDQFHYKFMQRFWQRSLSLAQSSQVLAKLTRYHLPAEAYLAGLLADVGQLCLLTENASGLLAIYQQEPGSQQDDDSFVKREQNELGITHTDFGAELVASWQLDNFMSDAVRYHHEPASNIQQSHHLVKIVNLASDLSHAQGLSNTALQKAHELFGLNEDLVNELHLHIQADVMRIRLALDMEQEHSKVQGDLGNRLQDINQIQTLTRHIQRSKLTTASPATPFAVSMLLGFGIEKFLVFTFNAGRQSLEVLKQQESDVPAFDISTLSATSLLVQAFQNSELLQADLQDVNALCILDQQLVRHFRQPHVLFMPFQADGIKGVVVAGVNTTTLAEQQRKSQYWRLLLDTCAHALVTRSAKTDDDIDRRIRETIHEVSNPLTIINNYLEVLRLRLGADSATDKELAILKDEIDRIGGILLRLKNPDSVASHGKTDLNGIVNDLARIFRESLCATRGITVTVRCDPALNPVYLDQAALKQILTNLIKNAVEAMPNGGVLTLDTRALVMVNGRPCAAISVEDNGPGIDQHILSNLFEPSHSTKGNGHSGLGLSVVKRLMESMKAEILCRSDATGTQFKLLFPIHKERG